MGDLRFDMRLHARRRPLVVLTVLLLCASCGKSSKDQGKPAGASQAAQTPVAPPPPPPALPAAEAGSGDAAGLGGAVPAAKPAADQPPELAAVKARVIQGDRSTRTLKELQKLSYKYPKNAEVAYILGQFYCGKLWMGDGLEHFRRAIKLEPTLRTNPYLIKAVIPGLGNDSDHMKVQRFLVRDIGQPAAPFVEEVLKGNWRQQVKDRASAVLRELK